MADYVSMGAEAWTYFGVNFGVVFARIVLRWRAQTFRGLDVDDYLMVVALQPIYAAAIAVAYLIEVYSHGLANNGLTPEQRAALDPDGLEWRLRVRGSQLHLSGWLLYTAQLWTLKLCWLFFYRRLGDRVSRMTLKVNLGFVFVGSTYVATLSTIIFKCWPFAGHWQINPDPGNHCYPAIAQLQTWMVVCCNLATDVYIMTIPLSVRRRPVAAPERPRMLTRLKQMIWRARISVKQKLGLGAMFCCGLITVGFGAARCVLILGTDSGDTEFAAKWSYRESFFAVFISNVPVLFPLIRQELRRFSDASGRGGWSLGSGDGDGAYKLSALSSHTQSGKAQARHVSVYGGRGSEESIVSVHQPVAAADAKGPNSSTRTM